MYELLMYSLKMNITDTEMNNCYIRNRHIPDTYMYSYVCVLCALYILSFIQDVTDYGSVHSHYMTTGTYIAKS